MTTRLRIPALSLSATVSSVVPSATFPWTNAAGNTVNRAYRWTLTLTIAQQNTSSFWTRAPMRYTGQDVTIGHWIANLGSGAAYQIVSIASKSDTTVSVTVEDANRYLTYRNPSQLAAPNPPTGSYAVFAVADNGQPSIDPIPVGASASFLAQLLTRFQYFNKQYDYALSQPDNSPVSFAYGDLIAIDPITKFFVVSNTNITNVIGRCTGVLDTGTTFFIEPIARIIDSFDSLPGDVGDQLFSSLAVPGALTTNSAGVPLYIKIRNSTPSSVDSATVDIVNPILTILPTTVRVNGVNVTIASGGTASDIVNAFAAASSQTGVNATIVGSVIRFTAVDARAIGFHNVSGDNFQGKLGVTSVENGIKAAALTIPADRRPVNLLAAHGFVYTQPAPQLVWTIVHNANSTNVVPAVYGTDNISVIPDEIQIIDINTVQISFGAPQAGKADLTIFV